jgi:hypothetical protein
MDVAEFNVLHSNSRTIPWLQWFIDFFFSSHQFLNITRTNSSIWLCFALYCCSGNFISSEFTLFGNLSTTSYTNYTLVALTNGKYAFVIEGNGRNHFTHTLCLFHTTPFIRFIWVPWLIISFYFSLSLSLSLSLSFSEWSLCWICRSQWNSNYEFDLYLEWHWLVYKKCWFSSIFLNF